MSKENRQFRMHPQLLFDVIQRQAGTLSKALLEGVMNAVDAGAKECKIRLTKEFVTVDDDGCGFRNRKEITTFFEVFGQPHDECEKKTFGTFRMGRGQMFAFGANTWETQEFVMDVDIKHKGLEYVLRSQDHKIKRGCGIRIQLYEKLLPSALAETEQDLRLWCRWMPIKVTVNGKQISTDPSPKVCDWTRVTDDAYIKLDERSELHAYNLGAHVKSFPKHHFGIGGEIVTRKTLQVNFARNDIQASCLVWKRIVPLVDQYAKDRNTSKKSLDDAARQRLANQARQDKLTWYELVGLPLFTAVTGRHYKLLDLPYHHPPISVAPKGNRLGDMLHRQKAAFILAEETLTRFAIDSVPELLAWIKQQAAKASHMDYFCDLQYIPFAKLSKGAELGMELVPVEKCSSLEKVWLELIEKIKYHLLLADEVRSQWDHEGRKCVEGSKVFSRERQTFIGLSDGAEGWTDAATYVAINRKWLVKQALNMRGFLAVGCLLLHEYCHREPDLKDHDHDQAFYELYHDSSDQFLAEFVHRCMAGLPKVLQRHQRRLTKQQLRQQDGLVLGQRGLEQIETLAARAT